ncbi:unnamed protein product [Sympodiomycopsis kandeliae]
MAEMSVPKSSSNESISMFSDPESIYEQIVSKPQTETVQRLQSLADRIWYYKRSIEGHEHQQGLLKWATIIEETVTIIKKTDQDRQQKVTSRRDKEKKLDEFNGRSNSTKKRSTTEDDAGEEEKEPSNKKTKAVEQE